jgi:superfamily I DNA/RNA helicase
MQRVKMQTQNTPLKRATKEQLAIVRSAVAGNDLIIKAFAGSGKTSTLCLIANNMPSKKCIYLAFNKAIAEEAKSKFPKSVIVKTTHALAYAAVSKVMNLKDVRPDYRAAELKSVIGLEDYTLSQLTTLVFGKFCSSDAKTLDAEFVSLAADEDPELASFLNNIFSPSEIAKYASELYKKMEDGEIAPTHSFYLKHYQLSGLASKDRFDVILLDEAQDTNKVTLDIVKQLKGQKIIVGDGHQKIYGFRGSLNIMELIPNAKHLYLTQSFRFGSNIADRANTLLARFKNETVSIIGSGGQKAEGNTTGHITRTNSQIVSLIADFVGDGDQSSWTTVRKPDEIFAPSLSVCKLFLRSSIDYIVPTNFLWLKQFSSITELERYAEETNDTELRTAIKIAKIHKAALLKFLLIAQSQFGSNSATQFLTTAHTAKGLEWDNVFLYQDFGSLLDSIAKHFASLDGFLKAKGVVKEKLEEEINLLYVALTRARATCTPLFADANMVFDVFNAFSTKDINKEIGRRYQAFKKAAKRQKMQSTSSLTKV